MLLGTFVKYRDYSGTIENIYNPDKTNLKTKTYHKKYNYYGRLLDTHRENILYAGNTLEELHIAFQNVVDNYISHNIGCITCPKGADESCNYDCNNCNVKQQSFDVDDIHDLGDDLSDYESLNIEPQKIEYAKVIHTCEYDTKVLCVYECYGDKCHHHPNYNKQG